MSRTAATPVERPARTAGRAELAAKLRDREAVADRLLEASRRHSFDPDTELDWDAPFTAGAWFWPPELTSLYGTPLWERMDEERRIELSRHECASLASAGIWFETILMQLLTRHIYDLGPTTGHVRYALTEIADECRHSSMFGRLVTVLGTPVYGPTRLDHNLARVMKTVSTTPGSFTGALLVEEVLDWMQRQTFPDERVQPLVRGVTRIHVVEEARHVRYAREELRRQLVSAPYAEREYVRLMTAQIARVVARTLVSPRVYAKVGLDPDVAVAQARMSPHRQAVMQRAAGKLVDFFQELGVIRGPVSRAAWRSTGWLA